jgi:hypothetical protein
MIGVEQKVLEAYPCDAANNGPHSELSGMTSFKTFVQSFAGMERPKPRDRTRGTARHEADPRMST